MGRFNRSIHCKKVSLTWNVLNHHNCFLNGMTGIFNKFNSLFCRNNTFNTQVSCFSKFFWNSVSLFCCISNAGNITGQLFNRSAGTFHCVVLVKNKLFNLLGAVFKTFNICVGFIDDLICLLVFSINFLNWNIHGFYSGHTFSRSLI